ncbi:hypothetical protein PR048_018337 [Dryococelus australis]|uniref:Uncharacterized protein n=1 Tax=Dryococelus australis TaxID=614101 RepID=A0ABQ9HBZ9_9NEOP|nr:hypothetical protein PR048_018337 [Dryococelus australis]
MRFRTCTASDSMSACAWEEVLSFSQVCACTVSDVDCFTIDFTWPASLPKLGEWCVKRCCTIDFTYPASLPKLVEWCGKRCCRIDFTWPASLPKLVEWCAKRCCTIDFTWPASLPKLGEWCAKRCCTIDFTWPASLPKLGEWCAKRCCTIDFTWPASLPKLGEWCAKRCCTIDFTWPASLPKLGEWCAKRCCTIDFTWPASLPKLGEWCAKRCCTIDFTWPASLPKLGEWCAKRCCTIDFTWPASLPKLGEWCVKRCCSIDFTWPASLPKLGDWCLKRYLQFTPPLAFRRCSILTSLHPHRLSRPPKSLHSTVRGLYKPVSANWNPNLMTTVRLILLHDWSWSGTHGQLTDMLLVYWRCESNGRAAQHLHAVRYPGRHRTTFESITIRPYTAQLYHRQKTLQYEEHVCIDAATVTTDDTQSRLRVSMLKHDGPKTRVVGEAAVANQARFPAARRRSRNFAYRDRDCRCRGSAGFLGVLPSPLSLHSGTAPYSPRFTLIASQDLVIWTVLNNEVLKVKEGELRGVWCNVGMQERGNRQVPEKTRRPAASSGTIPTCENLGATQTGIEPGFPWWEASSLTFQPPWPL